MYDVAVSDEVKNILSDGRCEGMNFYLPEGQLERSLYVEVNKVLELLGGKWNRKAKAHIFPEEARTIIDQILGSDSIVDKKKQLQFFETPPDVAKRMVELADIKDEMMVLEPSAGHGAIAEALVDYDHTKPTYNLGLIMVEIDPEKCKVLESKKIASVICADFLGSFAKEYGMFDRILMNPPFAKQQDITHVLHAYENCLYPGGKLVAIMSPGFTFRTNKKSVEFKELIDTNGSWDFLPEGAFKDSGTNVRTVMVILKKPLP